VILYVLAIGPVRGFAFTLGLATVIDFFAAWFFARPSVSLLTRLRLFQEGRFVGIRAAV
jgi:preprotein translocase subunit SecD